MNKKLKRPSKNQGKRPPIEWIGGIASLAAELTEEGESYHPHVLVWMEDGLVLGSQVTTEDEVMLIACASLLETMVAPLVGDAREPTRVRVASAELAEVLRAGYPKLEVVVAPTPMFTEMFARLAEEETPEYALPQLSENLDAAAVGSFFQNAAALYRLELWKMLPSSGALFSVSIPELGVSDGVLSVMSRGDAGGQDDQSVQFSLFSTVDSFADFLHGVEDVQGGSHVASHLLLTFEHEREILLAVLQEVSKRGWEVAGPHAYPEVVSVDSRLATRAPTAKEITMATVVSRGLVEIMAAGDALQAAWKSERPVSGLFSVSTHQGDVQVSLSTPFMPDVTRSVVSELAALGKGPPKRSKAEEAKRKSKRKAARKARRKKR